ncbi:unnamed protein product [Orchesella dallaii]|uniref:Serine aminopeptidase S33 domain-containing protein n=1 Tax=Orchesella dallaii TaxID=48710 RepID=A0ABP1PRB1_9HEXA
MTSMFIVALKRLRALPIVIVRLRHQIGLYFDLIVGIIASFLAFWFYYRFFVVQKPKVISGNEILVKFLSEHVKLTEEKHYPPWIWDGRLQTYFSTTYRDIDTTAVRYRRKLFTFSDGGQTALDMANLPGIIGPTEQPLIVVIIPGIYGDSKSNSMITLVECIVGSGAKAYVINYRGMAGLYFRNPKLNVPNDYSDFAEVVKYLKEQHPNDRMVLIAHQNMAGTMACEYFRAYPEEAKQAFLCAIFISVEWDTVAAYKYVTSSGWLADYFVHRTTLDTIKNICYRFHKQTNRKGWKPGVRYHHAMRTESTAEFMKFMTAPQGGYPTVEAYLESVTQIGRIQQIPVPVFSIHANDDPTHPGKFLPFTEAQCVNSKLCLIVYPSGGNMGFLDSFNKKPDHILERLIRQMIVAIRHNGESLAYAGSASLAQVPKKPSKD